ncbi:phospholipase D-like domain-containing protein [Ignisphaera sp. 4213-co]|uniref:Phospholipase D-like domain-containing protein n=1 Tax=Ignisphaera cupida TaxID=3050454 RepID=A0ABD4Z476_9CREN|nr:phospholipase D-like domain-containing protein [Ignisphaera sp. 4213-co]MDK6028116.1 phospholipase D-like domain-containing protein [Ignisphaera sp. 4213-co]
MNLKPLTIFLIGLLLGFAIAYLVSMPSQQSREKIATTTQMQTTTKLITLTKSVVTTYTQYAASAQQTGCKLIVLLDKEYLKTVSTLLQNANKSIYIIMYAMKYDPKESGDPVNTLLNTIVLKNKEGIDVKIIVDDVTYKDYPETISYLINNKINVKLDESSGKTTHAKIVIVDNKTAVIGSHNWTESALTLNHEVSIETNCSEVVEKLLKYFNMIWGGGRTLS